MAHLLSSVNCTPWAGKPFFSSKVRNGVSVTISASRLVPGQRALGLIWYTLGMGRKRARFNRHLHQPAHYHDLGDVLTVAEAASRYHYEARTVRYWCTFGKVAARNAGGVWLISRRSLETFLRSVENQP